MTKPLWSNKDITTVLDLLFSGRPVRREEVQFTMESMRDEYQAQYVETEAALTAAHTELAAVLQVAIARGEQLGYEDDDYRARYHELTGRDYDEGDGDD